MSFLRLWLMILMLSQPLQLFVHNIFSYHFHEVCRWHLTLSGGRRGQLGKIPLYTSKEGLPTLHPEITGSYIQPSFVFSDG